MKNRSTLLTIALFASLCTLAQYDRSGALTDASALKSAPAPSASAALADPGSEAPLSCKGQCTWYPSVDPIGPSVLYQVFDIRGQWALMNKVEMSDKKAWVYLPSMGGCWVVPEPTTQNVRR